MVSVLPDAAQLEAMDAESMRRLARELIAKVKQAGHEIDWRDAKIEKLTYELALSKRYRFAAKSEQFDSQQKALFIEDSDIDLERIDAELTSLQSPATTSEEEKKKPKRAPLPANLPRREYRHEPDSTVCSCGCQMKRIGEDVSEKLDYTPGVVTVDRHIRGKWTCDACEKILQAPVAPEVIDKGLPTSGLLAHVLVAKYQDHLPLYRQEAIFGRAGLAIPRSTLAAWVGASAAQLQPLVAALKDELLQAGVLQADETPVSRLAPGEGKTHRSYLWSYVTGAFEPLKAVVYDFTDSRSGENARDFLGEWRGRLVCDDFSGYKALFALGVTEAGCMAHARRKFVDLHKANKSESALVAIEFIGQLYGIEREVKDLKPEDRLAERRRRSQPIANTWHEWMMQQRRRATHGTALAKALDYSLNRWGALIRYLDDPALPIDNNHDERQIRPWATGRKNWLFAGTLLAGQRAAAVMSLIQSAKLNGHDPYLYLRDVLARLPTQKNRDISELMPHRWQQAV
jgi:transposase